MYSQRDEEPVLVKLFEGQEPGVFVDIGAYDGITFSNTRRFAESGWAGLCVEPSPAPLWHLATLYRDNPKVRVVGAAVHPDVRTALSFHVTADALSTSEAGNYRRWGEYVRDFAEIYTVTITVADLRELVGDHVDLMSIDTEGTSVAVFSRVMSIGWRPKVIVVEFDNREQGVRSMAEEYGYDVVHRTSENLILVRRAA